MEKIKEQWKLGIEFRQALRHLLNFIIGVLVLSFTCIAMSFIVGAACSLIVRFYKYGYGLW